MEHNLTIKEAVQLFKNYGKELSYAFNNFVQNDKTSAITNDYLGTGGSYLHSLYLVGIILNKTRNSLRMVVGGSCDLMFEALETELRETLKQIKKNHGFVKIVQLSGHSDFLERLATEYAGTLSIIHAKTNAPVMHFIVSDSCMLREEQPHQPLTLDSSSDCIKATVYLHNKKIAKASEDLFDSLWEHLAEK